MNKESIVLGSGDLYCTEFTGTNAELPSNEALETEENRLGHIKGGAEIEYAPSFYEAKDDMGKVSKVILTEEEATFKSGIMTWCGETLKKLCQTARVTEDAQKKIRTVKIGGVGNADGTLPLLRCEAITVDEIKLGSRAVALAEHPLGDGGAYAGLWCEGCEKGEKHGELAQNAVA